VIDLVVHWDVVTGKLHFSLVLGVVVYVALLSNVLWEVKEAGRLIARLLKAKEFSAVVDMQRSLHRSCPPG
jgi:hypothetical protein